jgi:hypothetical protein
LVIETHDQAGRASFDPIVTGKLTGSPDSVNPKRASAQSEFSHRRRCLTRESHLTIGPPTPKLTCDPKSHIRPNAINAERVAMQPFWVVTAASLGLVCGTARHDEQKIKLADCPEAVRKAFQAEVKDAKIDHVVKEANDDGETVYWAEVASGGKTYAIGVLEEGTLTEMNLAVDDKEVSFSRCPEAVQATLHAEALGEKVAVAAKDMKYGVTIYQSVVHHKGKAYQIVVAEDGTLVEKVLIIDDEEIDMAKCPVTVQTSLREHAKGGKIGQITRFTGIIHRTFEAEVEIDKKVYLIEVAEDGLLLSKSLEAGDE